MSSSVHPGRLRTTCGGCQVAAADDVRTRAGNESDRSLSPSGRCARRLYFGDRGDRRGCSLARPGSYFVLVMLVGTAAANADATFWRDRVSSTSMLRSSRARRRLRLPRWAWIRSKSRSRCPTMSRRRPRLCVNATTTRYGIIISIVISVMGRVFC
jgi:hypothetical protein